MFNLCAYFYINVILEHHDKNMPLFFLSMREREELLKCFLIYIHVLLYYLLTKYYLITSFISFSSSFKNCEYAQNPQ